MRRILRIAARPATGFWRCGVYHPPQPIEHNADTFTDEQIERLSAETMLLVEKFTRADKGESTSKSEPKDKGSKPPVPSTETNDPQTGDGSAGAPPVSNTASATGPAPEGSADASTPANAASKGGRESGRGKK